MMDSLELQQIADRAVAFENKMDATSIRWFYTHDVPKLLAEVERLRDERNEALWKVAS